MLIDLSYVWEGLPERVKWWLNPTGAAVPLGDPEPLIEDLFRYAEVSHPSAWEESFVDDHPAESFTSLLQELLKDKGLKGLLLRQAKSCFRIEDHNAVRFLDGLWIQEEYSLWEELVYQLGSIIGGLWRVYKPKGSTDEELWKAIEEIHEEAYALLEETWEELEDHRLSRMDHWMSPSHGEWYHDLNDTISRLLENDDYRWTPEEVEEIWSAIGRAVLKAMERDGRLNDYERVVSESL